MANQSKIQPAAASANNLPWRSWRHRLTLLQFRRGHNKQWYFSGQQPDEEIRLVVRKHWWFLVPPALPFIVSSLVLFIILWSAAQWPAWVSLWYLLELVAFLAMLGTGGWFAYRDLITWWYEMYIITNKRIINSRGLLEPTRQQTPIEKVLQVGIDFGTPLAFMLRYGLVHLYLQGGDLIMEKVPRPLKIKDAIDEISEGIKAKKP